MLSDQLHVQSEGAGQQRGFALTTQSSCPLHQSGWTRLSCGKEKHRVKSLNPSSLKGIFGTGLCFFGLTWYLLHAFYSFRPLSLEWTVLYNVISEHTNILWAGVKRTGADSLQWYPATGQGVTGTNWNTGHSNWVWEKKLVYFDGDRARKQVAQRGCGVSVSRDTQNLPRRDPVQPAVGEPTLPGRLD